MTEPTDPKSGDGQTSRHNPNNAGEFSPTPAKPVIKISVDGIKHPKTPADEAKTEFIIALSNKIMVGYGFEKGRVESLLNSANFETLALNTQTTQRQKIEKDLATFYQETQDVLAGKILPNDYFTELTIFETKLTNLQKNSNDLEDVLLRNATQKNEEYKPFIPCIKQLKELEQRISNEALENKDILALYNSLSWLSGAFDPLTFKKNASVDESVASLNKLETLINKLETTTTSITILKHKTPEQQGSILEELTNQGLQAITDAEKYKTTTKGSQVGKEISKKIQNLKNKLSKENKNKNDVELINSLIRNLTEVIEEAKQGPKPPRDEFANIYGGKESEKLISQIKLETPPLSVDNQAPPGATTPQQQPVTSTQAIPAIPQNQAAQPKPLQPLPSSIQPAPSIQINPQTHTPSSIPTQQIPNEPSTPNQTENKRAPRDINLPKIILNKNAKDNENKYKIKIDGKWETVPEVHWGTLNRYKEVFDNENYSEKNFSRAIALKDTVLDAIHVGNFEEADKHARALGAELNIIEEKSDESIAEDATKEIPASKENKSENINERRSALDNVEEEDEDLNAYKRRGYWNTRVPTISFDGKGYWNIKRGGIFAKMNAEELAEWLPINEALTAYSNFINSSDQAYSFPAVVQLKNELLDALQESDFTHAIELAKNLAREFDPMLDKDNIPDTEKTAARINYEDQQKNLKRLQDPLSVILHDDTTRFAFIEKKQIHGRAEFRIINRNSGDFVPLKKKDLLVVELAETMLTDFNSRESKDQKCITKKNEVLFHINNYDFEKAKIVINEYSAEFSKFVRRDALRPTISGSKPSPTIEKSNLTRSFTLEQEKLPITEEKLKETLPFLPSPLEKAAFKRLFDELKKLELSTSENLTRQSLETFTAKNNYLTSQLAKKKLFLEKNFAKIGGIPTVRLDKNTTVLRNRRLRGSAGASETLQERNERLRREQETVDITQSREINNKAELFEKHNNMFDRNPSLYKEIYANQNKVRDQITEDLSTIALADTPVPSEDERRSNFIKNLVARTPEEHLEDLIAQKESIVGRKRKLMEMSMNNDAPENHKEMMETVENELRSITNEIQKYTDAIVSKFRTTKTEPTNESLLSRKQVYNPEQDESLTDMTRGLGRNYILDENNEPVKIDRAALTKEQIEDIYASEINPNDPSGIQHQKEKVNFLGSLYPNHTEGMVSSLNNNEASLVDNTYKVDTLNSAQALYNKDLQAMEDIQAEQDSLSEQPDRTPSENQVKEKLFRVGKVVESLVKKLNPTTTKQWFMLGLTTIGLAAGSAATLGTIEKNKIEDRRLLDEIKKQPGWKNFLGEKVPEQFVKDFTGLYKLSYEELITKQAPSFGINQNNPSAKDKLSNLLCKNIYFTPGANAGISAQQQTESSTIVSNLKEIMLASKASVGILYPEKDIESGAIFKDMTLRQFYEEVTKAVTEAESERARLQAIKR